MEIKVISGGQTGMDRYGLVVARKLGMKTGGFTVKGFITENGAETDVLKDFGLIDCEKTYKSRTWRNVEESNITLIWSENRKSAGTVCTIDACNKLSVPCYVNQWVPEVMLVVLKKMILARPDVDFFVINVAGNRASRMSQDFGRRAVAVLYKTLKVLKEWKDAGCPDDKVEFKQL